MHRTPTKGTNTTSCDRTKISVLNLDMSRELHKRGAKALEPCSESEKQAAHQRPGCRSFHVTGRAPAETTHTRLGNCQLGMRSTSDQRLGHYCICTFNLFWHGHRDRMRDMYQVYSVITCADIENAHNLFAVEPRLASPPFSHGM